MQCDNCGAIMPEGSFFCAACGGRLDEGGSGTSPAGAGGALGPRLGARQESPTRETPAPPLSGDPAGPFAVQNGRLPRGEWRRRRRGKSYLVPSSRGPNRRKWATVLALLVIVVLSILVGMRIAGRGASVPGSVWASASSIPIEQTLIWPA